MDSPLDALEMIVDIQGAAVTALEESEETLAAVRDLLNETLRNKDNLEEKDLLVVLLKAQSGLVAGMICSNQNQIASAKQALITQKTMIQEMKKKMDDMFKNGGMEPPWGSDDDK